MMLMDIPGDSTPRLLLFICFVFSMKCLNLNEEAEIQSLILVITY